MIGSSSTVTSSIVRSSSTCVEVCDKLADALEMLDTFDVVGTTDCMREVFLTIADRLRLLPESPEDAWVRMSTFHGPNRPRQLIRSAPMSSNFPGSAIHALTKNLGWRTVDASTRAQMLHVVGQCDLALYHGALKRAAQMLPGRCNNGKDTHRQFTR